MKGVPAPRYDLLAYLFAWGLFMFFLLCSFTESVEIMTSCVDGVAFCFCLFFCNCPDVTTLVDWA